MCLPISRAALICAALAAPIPLTSQISLIEAWSNLLKSLSVFNKSRLRDRRRSFLPGGLLTRSGCREDAHPTICPRHILSIVLEDVRLPVSA